MLWRRHSIVRLPVMNRRRSDKMIITRQTRSNHQQQRQSESPPPDQYRCHTAQSGVYFCRNLARVTESEITNSPLLLFAPFNLVLPTISYYFLCSVTMLAKAIQTCSANNASNYFRNIARLAFMALSIW